MNYCLDPLITLSYIAGCRIHEIIKFIINTYAKIYRIEFSTNVLWRNLDNFEWNGTIKQSTRAHKPEKKPIDVNRDIEIRSCSWK